MKIPIHIRRATDDDIPFIATGWLQSYRSARDMLGVHPAIYYETQRPIIDGLIKHCVTDVVVSDADDRQLLAFMNYISDSIINYIYVKSLFRQMGIAHMLVSSVVKRKPAIMTMHTPYAVEYISRRDFAYAPGLCIYAAHGDFERPVFERCVDHAQRDLAWTKDRKHPR